MPRLFIAVDPPKSVAITVWNAFEPWRDQWSGIRWEKPDKLHITMKFLGSVDIDRVARIRSVLGEIVKRQLPFEAGLDEAGAFPTPLRPRVVWVGIGMGSKTLIELSGMVENAMNSIGFPMEKRRFSAHITVGRIKRYGGALPLDRVEIPSMDFPIHHIILKESTLTPRGSIYRNIAEFPFSG